MILTISQTLGSVNISAKSPEETSSPEDHKKLSLPGFDPFSSNHLAAGVQAQKVSAETDKTEPSGPLTSPLLTEGVFPYQVGPRGLYELNSGWKGNLLNAGKAGVVAPIEAFIAAAVTMAVVSLKETGKVDYQSILFLLNSTDFYSGVLGSLSAAYTESNAALVFKKAAAWAGERAPGQIKPVLTAPAMRALMNVVNGIAYTVAVSAGFEYFSQIWKYATRNIPEAKSVSGLIGTSGARRKQVILNLMYYTLIDANMRSRIFSSVYRHRIMTFEFIATNVAMYVGGQAGYLLAKKYGKDSPWATRLGPIAGSISAGVLVQMLPDNWKSGANQKLLRWKIQDYQRYLNSALNDFEEGITKGIYPTEEPPVMGIMMTQASVKADIDRIFRYRDMLVSFQMQEAVVGDGSNRLVDMRDTFKLVSDRLSTLQTQLGVVQKTGLRQQMEKWMAENKNPEEVYNLVLNFDRDEKLEYYNLMLDSAVDRSKNHLRETENLLNFVKTPPDFSKIAPDFAIQGK